MKIESVLFVCHGNICRSPMAEFVMRDLLRRSGRTDVHVESCATSTEEIGSDTYPPVKDVLKRHGVPFSPRRARRITCDDYARFDLIVAMDDENLRNTRRFTDGDPEGKVRLLMSFTGEDRGVADPWYTGDFEETYSDVSRACAEILAHLDSD